jgi:hypothetical protein
MSNSVHRNGHLRFIRMDTSPQPIQDSDDGFPSILPLRRTDTMLGEFLGTVPTSCQFCAGKFNVSPADVSWRNVCPTCYLENARKCSICNERNVKIGAGKWVTSCTTCWLAKRVETHATCPTCPDSRKTHLRRPKNRPMCIDCYRESKRK